jgi:hypothetical protein
LDLGINVGVYLVLEPGVVKGGLHVEAVRLEVVLGLKTMLDNLFILHLSPD